MNITGRFKDIKYELKLCPLVLKGLEPQKCVGENCIFWKDGKCCPELKKHDFEFK